MLENKLIKGILFTIGHGNIPLDEFLQILRQNHVDYLIDVRSMPYSSYASQFNQESLTNASAKSRIIHYVFMGNQLGGKPSDLGLLTNGVPDYKKMKQNEIFKNTLNGIIKRVRSDNTNIALMCSEENPEKCHRFLLISEYLYEQGQEVHHIRHSGEIVLHSRLRGIIPPEQLSMFFAGEQQ